VLPADDDTSGVPPVEEAAVEPPDVAVEPPDPLAGESLRCAVQPSDAQVNWAVDGEPVDVTGFDVPGELVDGYQQWTCEAVRPGGVGAAASVEVEEACTAFDVAAPLVAPYDPRLDLSRRAGTVEAWFFLDVPKGIPAGEGVRFTLIA